MEVHELATILESGLKDLAGRIDQTNVRLDQTNARIDETNARLDETNAQLGQTNARMGQTNAELGQTNARIDATRNELRDEMRERFGRVDGTLVSLTARVGRVEDGIHQVHIVVEGVRDDIKLLAEGIKTVDDKLDRHIADSDRQYEDIQSVFRNYGDARR